jgi:hypothetical protein
MNEIVLQEETNIHDIINQNDIRRLQKIFEQAEKMLFYNCDDRNAIPLLTTFIEGLEPIRYSDNKDRDRIFTLYSDNKLFVSLQIAKCRLKMLTTK